LNQVPKAFVQDAKDAVEEGKAVMDGKEPAYKPVSRPRQERDNGASSRLPKAVDVPEDEE
jgi:hypothetical protein